MKHSPSTERHDSTARMLTNKNDSGCRFKQVGQLSQELNANIGLECMLGIGYALVSSVRGKRRRVIWASFET